jgi:hypothetical protein
VSGTKGGVRGVRGAEGQYVVVHVVNAGQAEKGGRHPIDAVDARASRCGLQSNGGTTFPSRCLITQHTTQIISTGVVRAVMGEQQDGTLKATV